MKMNFRAISLLAVFLLSFPPAHVLADSLGEALPNSSSEPSSGPSQRLVQMLDYIGVDYPPTVSNGDVIDDVEYAEMREFSAELSNLLSLMPDNADKAKMLDTAVQIRNDIEQRLPGVNVATLTQQLKADLIESYQIIVGPVNTPDMTEVQALYEANCTSCHGQTGMGDGPLAAGLEIAPSDFHDMSRQYSRSVYDLYNTISLGVSGTPMLAFNYLNEEQRWALALMVSRYSSNDAQREKGKILWQQGTMKPQFTSLSDLTGMSYAKAEKLGNDLNIDGKAVLVYLRSSPDVLDVGSNEAIDKSISMLVTSLEFARAGDRKQAREAALSAYLDGFELAEASLTVVDKKLKSLIEKEMIIYRELTKKGSVDDLEAQQEIVVDLLIQAKETISSSHMSPTAAFFGSFIILLREGVEAILVLAAIMAALIKTGRKEAMKYIHAGWVSAIVLGIATWWVAESLISISGASREITEGVAALFAAVILVYVGFWLHNASNSKRWQKFVEHKVDNAMENSTLWVLGTVAFIAVYREMFETVLFYQAMWAQIDTGSENGFLLGIVAAIGLLVVLAFLIFRVGTKLPIKQFFQINAVLLFLLAVIFSGQGVAALQEAGVIATSIFDFPSVEILGIYPTAQSIGLQLFVLLLGGALLAYQRKTR
jgi:high-affinity iron transporter